MKEDYKDTIELTILAIVLGIVLILIFSK